MDTDPISPKYTLVDHLRATSRHLIRWCTPSLLGGPDLDPWQDDLSISYAPAGSMLDHSNWFAGAESRIASAHGSQKAFLVPAGSTTCNLVVARAIARSGTKGEVLLDRQAHHSMVRGLTAFGVKWSYIDTGRWDRDFECPKPVRPRDVARAIHRAGDVAAVCIVSTTYGGEVANLAGIREVIEREAPGALLAADGAWESHFPFHDDLAPLRAARYADLISHSSHKAAGALQPGAVLLWNDGPLAYDVVDASYLDLMSTSASFIISASIDHAYGRLSANGNELLGRSIRLAAHLADGLRAGIPGIRLLADERKGMKVALDPTKVTIALPPGPITGYAVRDALAEQNIVVEKATPASVTFLATFGLDEVQVDTTVAATVEAVARLDAAGGPARRTVPDPFAEAPAVHAMAPWDAQRAAAFAAIEVPMDEAIGRIAVEQVEAYPPGVAIISEGFEVTAGAVEWLRAVRSAGGNIVARRPDLDSLRVLATTSELD
jgi:lysine decarboxylase